MTRSLLWALTFNASVLLVLSCTFAPLPEGAEH